MNLLSKLPTPGALKHAFKKHFFPDSWFVRSEYKRIFGKKLNLRNPKGFNEKINWLKLYWRKPFIHGLVDKYAVKKYVAKKIGDQYVIPILGVWKNFDEINFAELPDKFVLKTTHGGGFNGVVICHDRNNFNFDEARIRLNAAMKWDLYKENREWVYKDIPHRIIAEEYITNGNHDLKDYKFFCFNGVPKFVCVHFDRQTNHKAVYMDLNWERLPFVDNYPCPPKHIEPKPENLDAMIGIARKLSDGMPFVRVDLYNIDGNIYFGELTFIPMNGMTVFDPPSADLDLGSCLQLPKKGV